MRRRRVGTCTAAVVVVFVAVVLVAAESGGPRLPPIGGVPEQADGTIPQGWVTITAGEIAVSIPPDWHIQQRFQDVTPPDGAGLGGPCPGDLYRPLPGLQQAEGPVAVVYDLPTDGACTMIGHSGPPDWPGLVLYETVRQADGRPGQDRRDMAARGERDRLGQLDVWRSTGGAPTADIEPTGIVAYVAIELTGGIWVSHHDDPVVQRILATARPAQHATNQTGGP